MVEDIPFEGMEDYVSTRLQSIVESGKFRLKGRVTVEQDFSLDLFQLIHENKLFWENCVKRNGDDIEEAINEFIDSFTEDIVGGYSNKAIKLEASWPEFDWDFIQRDVTSDLITELEVDALWP